MPFIDRLAEFWEDAEVARNPGASAEKIVEFEQRNHITLPEDVRRFYSRFNGTSETDAAFIEFWPLDEIDTIPNKLSDRTTTHYRGIGKRLANADDYFVFADHSIWVHLYAMRLRGDGSDGAPVLWIADGNTFNTIAKSFSEFWAMYLDDPGSVIAP